MFRLLLSHRVLTTIIAAGLAVRVASALYQGDAVVDMPGIYDQISYDALARRVLGGYGFTFAAEWWPLTGAGEPTAHWSYLYTLFLTTVYALFGTHPVVARLIQAVIAGVLQPWLTWRLGTRLFGPRAGMLAAAFSSVYAYFVYYAGALMTETYFILAVLWALDLATALQRGSSGHESTTVGALPARTRMWVLLGLALGIATLLRQVVLLFVPILLGLLVWAAARHRREAVPYSVVGTAREAAVGSVYAVAVILFMIAPWTLRNYGAFDRFVLLNTNAGYAFFWANHPNHGTSFVSIWPGWVYTRLIPGQYVGLDEATLDQALLKEGIRFVVEDPARYALLSISRVRDYFTFWPSSESSREANLARVLSFGIALPLMFHGIWLSLVRKRSHLRAESRVPLVILYVFLAFYTLIHLLSWALIRYRLPVDAVLLLFAGYSAAALGDTAGAGFRRSRSPADFDLPPTETPSLYQRSSTIDDHSRLEELRERMPERQRGRLWN